MTLDPIVYQDSSECRVLDLRPDGIDCLPVVGLSSFGAIRPGPGYHVHPGCVEVCLCLRGNLTFETEAAAYQFLPGSIFVSKPDEPHRLKHNPKGLMLYRFLLALPRRGRSILGLDPSETEWIIRSYTHLPKRLFKSTPRVRAAFEALFGVYDTERLHAARRVKMKAAALELLVSVIEAARHLPDKAPDRVKTLMEVIRANPTVDYPVAKLAERAGFSESAFSELFKRVAGLPPHAYLVDCRIRRAQELLTSQRLSLKAISDMLCFSSTQHFSTAFKRIVGQTPAEFRNSPSATGSGSRNRTKFR